MLKEVGCTNVSKNFSINSVWLFLFFLENVLKNRWTCIQWWRQPVVERKIMLESIISLENNQFDSYTWTIVCFRSILPITMKFNNIHMIQLDQFIKNITNFVLKMMRKWSLLIEWSKKNEFIHVEFRWFFFQKRELHSKQLPRLLLYPSPNTRRQYLEYHVEQPGKKMNVKHKSKKMIENVLFHDAFATGNTD